MAMINDNNKKSEIDKVIDAHWEYNRGLLERAFSITDDRIEIRKTLELCEYCYKTAWVHGAKHALEKNHEYRCFGHYTDNCEKYPHDYPCPYKEKCKKVTDDDKEGL